MRHLAGGGRYRRLPGRGCVETLWGKFRVPLGRFAQVVQRVIQSHGLEDLFDLRPDLP